jgi:hypothetical protein
LEKTCRKTAGTIRTAFLVGFHGTVPSLRAEGEAISLFTLRLPRRPFGTPRNDELRKTMGKISILKEFWEFLKVRKKWWLAPMLIVLVLLGFLIVVTEKSAIAPFVYTLF